MIGSWQNSVYRTFDNDTLIPYGTKPGSAFTEADYDQSGCDINWTSPLNKTQFDYDYAVWVMAPYTFDGITITAIGHFH